MVFVELPMGALPLDGVATGSLWPGATSASHPKEVVGIGPAGECYRPEKRPSRARPEKLRHFPALARLSGMALLAVDGH